MKKSLLFLIALALGNQLSAQVPVEVTFGGPQPMYKFINFDQPGDAAYFSMDTTQGTNLWQIGAPQKSFFTAAASAPNAMVTDTLNVYPVNNVSVFNMEIINYNVYLCTSLQLQHRYQTTSTKDGGTIEVSHDHGLTWYNLIQDNLYLNNPYCGNGPLPYSIQDTVAALGKPGFSGTSSGWQILTLNFASPQMQQNDTIDLRFIFASDSIAENKDGWMIDNMVVGAEGEGVQEYDPANDISIVPNPVSNRLNFTRPQALTAPLTVTFFGANGQKLAELENVKGNSLDVPELPEGLYFVTFSSKDFYRSKKVLIQKP